MTPSRAAQVAALALEMRTPLARIELAATGIARELATPRGRALVGAISEAVAELDARIARSVALLVPTRHTVRHEEPLGVVREMRARLAPALAARGVTFAGDDGARPEAWRADGSLLRRTILALVHAGTAASRGEATLEVGVRSRDDRRGLALQLRTVSEPDAPRTLRRIADALRGFAASQAATLECEDRTLVVWMPPEAVSCPAR